MTLPEVERLKEAIIKMQFNDSGPLIEVCQKAGLSAVKLLNEGLLPALDVVGQLFRDGDYFLPDVLMSVRAYEAAYEKIKGELKAADHRARGKVLLGTVEGDIHEIGKNIVLALCQGNGYEVVDLGVNVKPEIFLEKARELNPDIIGMSALLTTTMPAMKETIDLFIDHQIRDKYKFIIGGSPVSQHFADDIGADGYAEDAQSGIELIKGLTS
jgi:5-methyltetrahydrofolate--homocysteine methyltransferase